MSFWSAIVIIVLIVSITQVMKSKHIARARTPGDVDPSGHSQRELELQREVEELRERIKVLERIATEGGETRRLADEIEKLRDN